MKRNQTGVFAAILSVVLTASAVAVLGSGLTGGPPGSALASAAFARHADASDSAPSSQSRIERRTFFSAALKKEMQVTVYIPPTYDSASTQHFPVLYMLHGLDGDEEAWRSCGLFKAADEAVAAGSLTPFIIVTPDGDNGYWVDQANRGPQYGSYIARDLVGFMDRNYKTLARRESRAIGGMSMGGHGALQLAMNFPDTFSVIGAHSVALRTYEQAFSFFGDRSYFAQHDPVQLFSNRPSTGRSFHIWIDVGREDPWYSAAKTFEGQLTLAGITHEWHEYTGGHDSAYWSTHGVDYLAFYGRWLDGTQPDEATFAIAHP